jgi:hypothetical protein
MNKYQIYNQRRINIILRLRRQFGHNTKAYYDNFFITYLACPWCDRNVRIAYKNHFKNHYRT